MSTENDNFKPIIIENMTNFDPYGFLSIAKRENNIKRKFLLVNKLQAKHMPSSPTQTLSYFDQLAQLVSKECENEKVLVIGFAETATAIGVAVASKLKDAYYCQTTREELEKETLVVSFYEEHSHAINQALYLSPQIRISYFDRIVFVEDEITTGKTILNFLNALCTMLKPNVKITIAALVIGLVEQSLFAKYHTNFCYLTKIDNRNIENTVNNVLSENGDSTVPKLEYSGKIINISGGLNSRLGVEASYYVKACENLAESIINLIAFDEKNTLILGSEEFMYPALLLGKKVSQIAKSVKSHSTTRSPIIAQNSSCYPINSRFMIKSLYDEKRQTYVYNLEKYDVVVVLFDSEVDSVGLNELYSALAYCGNKNIYFVRWRK